MDPSTKLCLIKNSFINYELKSINLDLIICTDLSKLIGCNIYFKGTKYELQNGIFTSDEKVIDLLLFSWIKKRGTI